MYNYNNIKKYVENTTLFEYGSKGCCGIDLKNHSFLKNISNKEVENAIGQNLYDLSDNSLHFPELSEFQVVRHFTSISQGNFCIDTNTYPLGSCTMKYNPRINEWVSNQHHFSMLHPYTNIKNIQFSLSIIFDLQNYLKEISGFKSISLQPSTGAHSELTGLAVINKAIRSRNEYRKKIIIPNTAHGTNPATAKMLNLDVINITSGKDGFICSKDVLKHMNKDVVGIMITNPNTLGIFESEIKKISDIVHKHGGYVYGDGANLNSLMGFVKPGKIGFDVLHFNLHKTFSTPHGGGGPGGGAIATIEELEKFLPLPVISKNNAKYCISKRSTSIGYIKSFFPNFSVILRAWTYIRSIGKKNLKNITNIAVLNSNYIRSKIKHAYHIPYKNASLHEIVISDKKQKIYANITALDIAKRLMDYKIHPPTIYFPLNVPGAIMIEPTETESQKDLDYLCHALISIAKESINTPYIVKTAPHNTNISRPNEVYAIKNPVLKWS